MKKFINGNWFRIVVIVFMFIGILILLRIEDELRMIHKYTGDAAFTLKHINR